MDKIVVLGFGEVSQTIWTNPQWMAQTFHNLSYDVHYYNPPMYRRPKLSDIHRLVYRKISSRKHGNALREIGFSTYSKLLTLPYRYFSQRELEDTKLILIFQPFWFHYLPQEYYKKCIYVKTDAYEVIHNAKRVKHFEFLMARAQIPCFITNLNLQYPGQKKYWPNCISKNYTNTELGIKTDDYIFIGSLSKLKINYDLLKRFIQSLNTESLTIIGKFVDFNEQETQYIINHPNVNYLGDMIFDQAFPILTKHKVGIMPFNLNSYTAGMQTMKYIEYLSANLKVLSVPLKMFEVDKSLPTLNLILDADLKHCTSVLEQDFKYEDLLKYTYEHRVKELKDYGYLS